MPIEVNNLTASTRLGIEQRDTRLSPAEIDKIAERVIEILQQRKMSAAITRSDNSARSLLKSD